MSRRSWRMSSCNSGPSAPGALRGTPRPRAGPPGPRAPPRSQVVVRHLVRDRVEGRAGPGAADASIGRWRAAPGRTPAGTEGSRGSGRRRSGRAPTPPDRRRRGPGAGTPRKHGAGVSRPSAAEPGAGRPRRPARGDPVARAGASSSSVGSTPSTCIHRRRRARRVAPAARRRRSVRAAARRRGRCAPPRRERSGRSSSPADRRSVEQREDLLEQIAEEAQEGHVRTDAATTCPATPHRTAENRFVAPTPMIAEPIAWVVETGIPRLAAAHHGRGPVLPRNPARARDWSSACPRSDDALFPTIVPSPITSAAETIIQSLMVRFSTFPAVPASFSAS